MTALPDPVRQPAIEIAGWHRIETHFSDLEALHRILTMNPPRWFFRGFGLLLILGSTMLSHGQDQWPRFRGVAGAGVSSQKGLPVQWQQGDYEWKTALPGLAGGSEGGSLARF